MRYKRDPGLGGCLWGATGLLFIIVACFSFAFMVMGFFRYLDPNIPVPSHTFVYSIVTGLVSFVIGVFCILCMKGKML